MTDFLRHATSGPVVATATRVAILVGSLLALINHGSALLAMTVSGKQLLQIALTYLVPYCVSTYSSVKMLRATAVQTHD